MAEIETKLPIQIVSKRDVIALQREVERQIEQRLQKKVAERTPGVKRSVAQPSATLIQTLEMNQLPVDQDTSFSALRKKLTHVRENAPSVRVSFSSEPSIEEKVKITAWFRKEVHPLIMMRIGVQPAIAGGVIVQTPNKRYDFSLRERINSSIDRFRELLNGGE